MRIISKFHDFYDPISQYDDDRSILYHRNYAEEYIDDLTGLIRHRQYGFETQQISIGLAGNIYPCVHVSFNYSGYQSINISEYLYDADSVIDIVGKKPPMGYYQRQKSKWEDNNFKDFATNVKKIFSEQLNYHKFFGCAPIFVIFHRSNTWERSKVCYNYELRTINFHKFLDPYTAYQNLRMYIESMAQPLKPIPIIDDETMQSIKGFDHKYSFRKEPSGKRQAKV